MFLFLRRLFCKHSEVVYSREWVANPKDKARAKSLGGGLVRYHEYIVERCVDCDKLTRVPTGKTAKNDLYGKNAKEHFRKNLKFGQKVDF